MRTSHAFISTALIVTASANSQLCFQENEIITTLFDPTQAVFADVDQDGDIDIISTSSPTPSMQSGKTPTLLWYENNGEIVPVFNERFLGNACCESDIIPEFRVVDFNNDGYPDVWAVVGAFFGEHVWYENQGPPSYGFTRRTTGWGGNPPLFFADLDGDGNTDIIQDNGRWFRYTGTGATHFQELIFSTGFTGAITGAADMDNDGDLDIVTNGDRLYLNDGSLIPQFTENVDICPKVGAQTYQIVDLNGDTYLDLLPTTADYFCLLNFPSNPGFFFGVGLSGASGPLTPGDIDLDGDIDLVGSGNTWLANDGADFAISFSQQPIHPSAAGPFTVRDLDGDGDIDLVNPGGSVWYRNNLIGTGIVSFNEESFVGLSPNSTPRMTEASLHDLNNDGDLDAILNREGVGIFSWFNNSTMTNLTSDARYGDIQAAIDESSEGDTLLGDPGIFDCTNILITPGHSTYIKSTGDLYLPFLTSMQSGSFEAAQGSNLDIHDLSIQPNLGGGLISPFLSGQTIRVSSLDSFPESSVSMIGDVLFAPRAYIFPFLSNPVPGVKQIQSGDLDNDGDIDTIVLSDNGLISWFAQSQQFHPWDGVQQTIPSAVSESFEVGDINGDGLLDIVGHDKGELFLFLNNGVSNGDLEPFTLQTIVAGEFFGGDIAVGDMDNDGDLDIVHGGLGSKSGGSVRLFTNNGANPPAFTATSVYSHRYFVHHINLIDLEQDGDLDILLAQDPPLNDESGIVVLTNNGTGPATFSGGGLFFYPPTAPTKVYGGDFDGDNDADILAMYPGGAAPRILLLENQYPSSGYRRRILDQQADIGNELAIGDFDSDGDLDFINDTLVYYENTGNNPAFFRKDDEYADGNGGAIHTIDYQQNGALDIARSGMQWSQNLDSGFMQFYGSIDISGDLDIKRSRLFMPDTSMGPTFFNVGGVMRIDERSELVAAVNTFEIPTLINIGALRLAIFIQPGDTFTISGDYAQFDADPSSEASGSLILHLEPNGIVGRFVVEGSAAFAGSLVLEDYPLFDVPISGEEPLVVAIEASSFETGRDQFDVYTAPVLTLQFSDGSTTQGTVIPVYNQDPGSPSTVTLVPITLEELLFTQNSFTSQGTPNDAVLADVTGGTNGLPDGKVDLIVAIPEIPGISPNGAVAIFQGAQTVNGFEMVSATLYSGPLVDAPGSVEVGYFDNDQIPDIAFANLGSNGLNNDVHFLHVDSSSPTPIIEAPLPSYNIAAGITVRDLATDQFVDAGQGLDDLLMGIQSNSGMGGAVRTIAFADLDWESCEVDVDDVDTVAPSGEGAAARGTVLADIVVTSPDSDLVTYFINTGDFENMIPIPLPTGRRPTEVLAQDLNGDGNNDLVVICNGSIGSDGVLTMVRNLGNDTFAPPVNIPLGTNNVVNPNPTSLALSDIDDDGDLDIVLVSVNDNDVRSVRVLRNISSPAGGLNFTAAADAPDQPNGTPLIVRSADLNGDSLGLADDIVVLVDPFSNIASEGAPSNSISLSGDFCPADLNSDGVLNFFDVSEFLVAFSKQEVSADFNLDGVFDFFDVSLFLTEYLGGCDSKIKNQGS